MSEAKALALFAIVYLVLVWAATFVAIDLGAGGVALGFLAVLICGAGGFFSSMIVLHYSDREERRKREEILLSR